MPRIKSCCFKGGGCCTGQKSAKSHRPCGVSVAAKVCISCCRRGGGKRSSRKGVMILSNCSFGCSACSLPNLKETEHWCGCWMRSYLYWARCSIAGAASKYKISSCLPVFRSCSKSQPLPPPITSTLPMSGRCGSKLACACSNASPYTRRASLS